MREPSDSEVPDDFVELVRERFLRQRGDADIVARDGALFVEVPNREPMRVGLYNLWRDIDAYSDRGPSDLTGKVDRFVQRALAPNPVIEDLHGALRLVLKREEEAEALGEDFVSRHDVPGLRTMLVADAGWSYQYVSRERLEEAGLAVEQALERALTNTRAAIEEKLELHRGEVVMLTCGGDFEATTLLLPDLWERLAAELGPLVVGVPARDLVFASSLAHRPGIARLQALVADVVARRVSHAHLEGLLYFTGQGWEPWDPGRLIVRTRTLHQLAERFATRPRATVVELVGWLTYFVDAQGTPQVVDPETLDRLVKEDILGTSLQVEVRDGYLEVTREEGEVANVAVLAPRTLVELAPDGAEAILFAIPDPNRIWVARLADGHRLREVMAGTRAPQLVFRVVADGAELWPGEATCTACGSTVPSDAFRCWRCEDLMLGNLWLQWLGSSIGAAVVIVALWYAIGWSTQPLTTAGALWMHLFWLGWPGFAVARGQPLRKAVGMYGVGMQCWLIAATPLLVLWRLPNIFEAVKLGPVAPTASGWLGLILYSGLPVTLLAVFLLTLGFYGVGVLKVWDDELPELR